MRRLFPDNNFVAPFLVPGDRLCVAEAPGELEAERGEPLVGPSGSWLFGREEEHGKRTGGLYRAAGVEGSSVSKCNVLNCRPPKNLFPTDPDARSYITKEEAEQSVQHCLNAHVLPALRSRPWRRLDILGDKALRALCQVEGGITRWRGSPLPVPALGNSALAVPTLHPSYISRDQSLLPAVVADLKKTLAVAPEYYNTKPSLEDLQAFRFTEFAVDIETVRATGEITMVGLCGEKYHGLSVPPTGVYLTELKRIFANATDIITWNGEQFDLPRLKAIGIEPPKDFHSWDGMLMGHLCFPDLPHDLGFAGSFFLNKPAWKHLSGDDETLYNIRDCDATFQIYLQLRPMLRAEKLLDLYQNVQVPLARICHLLTETGFRIDPARLKTVRADLESKSNRLEKELPAELQTREVPVRKRQLAPPGTLSLKTGKPLKYVMTDSTETVKPWKSSDILKDYFYEKNKLPVQTHAKTNEATLDKTSLPKLIRAASQVGYSKLVGLETAKEVLGALRVLQQLRQIASLLSTFLQDKWEDPGVERIHASFSVHGCLTPEHEVLTKNGWVPFGNYDHSSEIVQWSPDSDKLSWCKPLGYVDKAYKGPMLKWDARRLQALMTPDHNVPSIYYGKKGKRYVNKVAASELSSSARYPLSGNLENGKAVDAALIRYLVAVQADGSLDENGYVRFHLKRPRKIERLKMLMDSLGISPTISEDKDKPGALHIYCPRNAPFDLHTWFLPGKTFPLQELLTWNFECRAIFLEELKYWDGDRSRACPVYLTSNKANADTVQTLSHITGRSSQIWECCKHSSHWGTKTVYSTSLASNTEIRTSSLNPSTVDYDGTIHCTTTETGYFLTRYKEKIFVTGNTSSGRLSSSSPNLQNIPESARFIYVPSYSDWTIFDVDFSSLENRLVAWFSQDWERLEKMNQPGYSEHKENASKFFDIPIDEIVKDNSKDAPYGKGKRISHGMGYGMGPMKICKLYDLDFKEVKMLCDKWRQFNPKTVAWQEETAARAKADGFLTTPFGRKRWFYSSSAYTESLSYLPQSTGADITFRCLIAMLYDRIGWPEDRVQKLVQIYQPLPRPARILLQVHDSFPGETPFSLEAEVRACLKRVMTQPWPELGGLVIPVEYKSGPSWGECH